MRYHQSNGRRRGQQHATAVTSWGCPLYATLPTQAVDAVLDGLHQTAIATALPILGVAQSHAIRHDRRGQPIPVRAKMHWLTDATVLNRRTIYDALEELQDPLSYGWPAMLQDVRIEQGVIEATVGARYSTPRDHIRIPLPIPTDTRGAAVLAILIAENDRLSWPDAPSSRLPFRPHERTTAAVNHWLQHLDRDKLERYGIDPPRAVRQSVRVMLNGPARVLGTNLEF